MNYILEVIKFLDKVITKVRLWGLFEVFYIYIDINKKML